MALTVAADADVDKPVRLGSRREVDQPAINIERRIKVCQLDLERGHGTQRLGPVRVDLQKLVASPARFLLVAQLTLNIGVSPPRKRTIREQLNGPQRLSFGKAVPSHWVQR